MSFVTTYVKEIYRIHWDEHGYILLIVWSIGSACKRKATTYLSSCLMTVSVWPLVGPFLDQIVSTKGTSEVPLTCRFHWLWSHWHGRRHKVFESFVVRSSSWDVELVAIYSMTRNRYQDDARIYALYRSRPGQMSRNQRSFWLIWNTGQVWRKNILDLETRPVQRSSLLYVGTQTRSS